MNGGCQGFDGGLWQPLQSQTRIKEMGNMKATKTGHGKVAQTAYETLAAGF